MIDAGRRRICRGELIYGPRSVRREESAELY